MTGAKALSDKRILVTGGSRGLGAALCRAFADEGARVAFTYSRDERGAGATLEVLRGAGAGAKAFRASVLDLPATERIVHELENDWGGIDGLVNNAAITQNLPIALLEEEDWDQVVDVNLKGAYLVARAVLRSMIPRKSGAIVNIGSLAGERMMEAPLHYCASKAGLRGLTEALAKEAARHQIRVNNIAPGILEDGVGRNVPEYRLADYLRHCSLGRVGRLAEVAKLTVFLLSERASYVTGATILIDGGI